MIFSLLLPLLAQASPAPDRGAQIVMRVGGQPVERAEFEVRLLELQGENFASQFADQWLIQREARSLGVDDVSEEAKATTESEIKERIDKAYGGDQSKWLAELKSANRTPAGRRAERVQDLERDLRLRNIAAHERVVSDEKVERDWERQYGPEGRRYRVRLLFKRLTIPTLGGATREQQEAERERVRKEIADELLALRARAQAGEPFAGLVRDHSDDAPTRAAGGRPEGGFLDPVGWPQESIEAIAGLAPGGISEPVFAKGGLWLVQLEELVVTPLADVADKLRAALVARGPEPDELGAVQARLQEKGAYEVLPAMTDAGAAADAPVLRIDGTDVGRAEFVRWLVNDRGDADARMLGEDRYIEQLAEAAGIKPTPEEIEARITSNFDQMIDFYYGGDHEAWEKQNGSPEQWRHEARKRARVDLKTARLFEQSRQITEDMVRQRWALRYGAGGVSLHLRMIRVDPVPPDVPPDATPEEAKRLSDEAVETARKSAVEAARRAHDGEDFAALAKRFSTDSASRQNGGELPEGYDYKLLPPPVATAVEALAPGQVSEAIHVGMTNFVIEMLGRREVPYDTVKDKLKAELSSAPATLLELRTHRNQLTRDLTVEVLPELFD